MEKHFISLSMFEYYADRYLYIRSVGRPYAPRPFSRVEYIYT